MLRIGLALMVNAATNRRFSPFIVSALYDTAVHMGKIRRGEELYLDDERAAELFGIQRPTLSDFKEIRDILLFALENPAPGWSITRPTRAPPTKGRFAPREAPAHAVLLQPGAHASVKAPRLAGDDAGA